MIDTANKSGGERLDTPPVNELARAYEQRRLADPENTPDDGYMTAPDLYGYVGGLTTYPRGRIQGTCRNGCHCFGTRTDKSGNGEIFFGRKDTMRETLGGDDELVHAWLYREDLGNGRQTVINDCFTYPFHTYRPPTGESSLLADVCTAEDGPRNYDGQLESVEKPHKELYKMISGHTDPRQPIAASDLQRHLPTPAWIGKDAFLCHDSDPASSDPLILGQRKKSIAKGLGIISIIGTEERYQVPRDYDIRALIAKHRGNASSGATQAGSVDTTPNDERQAEIRKQLDVVQKQLADLFPRLTRNFVLWDRGQL